jgi:hypothetical protein
MGEPLTFEVEHFHLALNLWMRMMVPLIGKGFNVGAVNSILITTLECFLTLLMNLSLLDLSRYKCSSLNCSEYRDWYFLSSCQITSKQESALCLNEYHP